MGLEKTTNRISRYINKKFIEVVLGGVRLKLLFAQNPLSKGRTKAIVCKDSVTGKVISYNSIRDCLRDFNHSGDHSYFIKKYLKRGILYKDRYTFCYLSDYIGPFPVEGDFSKYKPSS